MGLIGRIGGRNVAAVGKLSDRSAVRWLALGPSLVADRTRSGLTVVASRLLNSSAVTIAGGAVSEAHPVSHCVDLHRQTYCEMPATGYYLELDLDTGGDARKEFLSLRYPEGAEVEVTLVQYSNEPAGTYSSAVGSLTAVNRGAAESLWLLPWRGDLSPSGPYSVVTVDGTVVTTSGGWSPGNVLAGYEAYFTSGLNVNAVRLVVQSTSGVLYLDAPFPHPVNAGEQVYLRYVKPNYLGSRYVRVRLRLKGSAGKDVLQLSHLGLHSFLFEFTGDRQLEFAEFPSNPAAVAGQFASGHVHTDLLNGGLDIEQRLSPRDVLDISWELMHAGQVRLLKQLALSGEFCLVDHHGEMRQGVVVPDGGIGWDDLARAVGRGEERAVRMTFREI